MTGMDQFSVQGLGKFLFGAGLVLTGVGLLLILFPHLPLSGKLPGDITIKGQKITLYLPLATGLALSLILTIIMNLFMRR